MLEKLKQNLFVYNCLDNRTNKMRKRKEITYPQKWQLLRKFPHLLVLVIAQIWFSYLHQNLSFHTQSVAEFSHKNCKSSSCNVNRCIQPFLFTNMCLFWSAIRALLCWDAWANCPGTGTWLTLTPAYAFNKISQFELSFHLLSIIITSFHSRLESSKL